MSDDTTVNFKEGLKTEDSQEKAMGMVLEMKPILEKYHPQTTFKVLVSLLSNMIAISDNPTLAYSELSLFILKNMQNERDTGK